MTVLAVPNVSEGRDSRAIAAIAEAFGAGGARVLDVHSDPDHNRSVFTLAVSPDELSGALVAGACEALTRIDMTAHRGVHPCVGAVDVVPVVHLDRAGRGGACAHALVAGDELARQLELPILLYGALAAGRTRSELRRGGGDELARRLAEGELTPDFGPRQAHPTAGVTLVGARPPLVAFNLELEPPATLDEARAVAAAVREGAQGLPGVRAIGLWLSEREIAQVSFNVEDPGATPLGRLVEAVRARVPVTAGELVGLAPRAAVESLPHDLPMRGPQPSSRVLENALGL